MLKELKVQNLPEAGGGSQTLNSERNRKQGDLRGQRSILHRTVVVRDSFSEEVTFGLRFE